jgi:hypothetical protein
LSATTRPFHSIDMPALRSFVFPSSTRGVRLFALPFRSPFPNDELLNIASSFSIAFFTPPSFSLHWQKAAGRAQSATSVPDARVQAIRTVAAHDAAEGNIVCPEPLPPMSCGDAACLAIS